MSQLPLFVFGTLRRGQANHHYLAGRYSLVRAAVLRDYTRIAPLMIAAADNSDVEGELYDIIPDMYATTLAGCDSLEGIPHGQTRGEWYERISVQVEVEGTSVDAWAYVKPS